MAFPVTLTNAQDGVTEIVAAHLNNLEAKVGIDGSAVVTSLDYLLKNPASIDPGHKHDHGGLQGLGDDDHPQYIKHVLATAANDFLVASGAGAYVKKTLAETRTILACLLLSGGTMAGNIAMGNNKITGLAAASGAGEAVRYNEWTGATDPGHLHSLYLKKDGSVALTGNWDIGAGREISAEQIMARSSLGLKLYEDGGKGIFVQDSTGNAGFGTTTPNQQIQLDGRTTPNLGFYSIFDTAINRNWALWHDGYGSLALRQSNELFGDPVGAGAIKFSFSVKGNIGIGTNTYGNNLASGIGIVSGIAPTSAPADMTQLWVEDINGAAGKAGLHMMAESGTEELIVAGVLIKATTGNPAQVHEGLLCINTNNDTLRAYANARWRNLDNGYPLISLPSSIAAPADATTYYWGYGTLPPSIYPDIRRIYVSRPGTVTAARITVYVGGLSTSEASSVWIRLNNTSNTLISAVVQCTAVIQSYIATGLSIPVVVGDYFEWKWTTPTWVTNPTSIYFHCEIVIT